MLTYVVTPKNKNSVKEINIWLLETDEHTLKAVQTLTWGTGEFLLHIPETPQEEDDVKDYVITSSKETGKFKEVPSGDIPVLHTHHYHFEMQATSGGADEDWSVSLESGEETDEILELIADAETGIEEEGDDYLIENDWEEDGYDYEISGGIELNLMIE